MADVDLACNCGATWQLPEQLAGLNPTCPICDRPARVVSPPPSMAVLDYAPAGRSTWAPPVEGLPAPKIRPREEPAKPLHVLIKERRAQKLAAEAQKEQAAAAENMPSVPVSSELEETAQGGRHRRSAADEESDPSSKRSMPLQASIPAGLLAYRATMECVAAGRMIRLSPSTDNLAAIAVLSLALLFLELAVSILLELRSARPFTLLVIVLQLTAISVLQLMAGQQLLPSAGRFVSLLAWVVVLNTTSRDLLIWIAMLLALITTPIGTFSFAL